MVDNHYLMFVIISFIGFATILIQHVKYYKKSEYKRNFIILVSACLLFCAVDFLWGLCASGTIKSIQIFFAITTVYYLMAGTVAFLFAFFIFYFCKDSFRYLKFIAVNSFTPLVFVVVITIINCFTKKVFYISEDGIYTRNNQIYIDLIYLMHYIYYVVCLFAAVYAYYNASRKNEHISRAVILFPVIPIITSVLQYRDPWQPYLSVGYFLAVLFMYTFENSYSHGKKLQESVSNKIKGILDDCTTLLTEDKSPEKNISQLLEMVVKYYNADDACISIFSDDNIRIDHTFYWNASRRASVLSDELNQLPKEILGEWYTVFKNHGELYISDTGAPNILKSFSKFCKKLRIKNCMSVPIVSNGSLVAILTVYNFDNYKNDFTLLRTIAYFTFSEILKRKSMDKTEEERKSIISALSQGYDCIYYISLYDDKITLYRHDDKVDRFFDIRDNETVPFTTSYRFYVENVVVPEDQEELLEFGSVSVLRNVLTNRKSVTKKFKSNISGQKEFYEAKWVKVEPENEPAQHVVLGYTNIEAKIQQRLREEREREIVQSQLDSAIEVAEEIVHKSQFDKLTGIYNKASGLEIMQKFLSAKEEDESYALLFMDLDNFKEINDTYGHLEGDDILVGVGQAIQENCRGGDIAVRFGGDEFVILLKQITEPKQAEFVAKKISEQINKLASGKFYYTTCSVGGYVTSSRELQSAMDTADKSLYDVKNAGRDGIKVVK